MWPDALSVHEDVAGQRGYLRSLSPAGRSGDMSDGEHVQTLKQGLVISAIGADRPGLIRDFSHQLRLRGGNLEDTRMTKLGGEFALLLLVTGSESSLRDLLLAKSDIESALDVVCSFKPTQSGQLLAGEVLRFAASGLDHAGIVEGISQTLADHRVNVTSFLSRLENAPLSGTPLFFLETEARMAPDTTRSQVVDDLLRVCEREGLDIRFIDD